MENKCTLCPNACAVDRSKNLGACLSGEKLKIAKYYLHPFEEPPVSGTNGSGTIFFTGCALKCVFCQNYELSRNQTGKEITTGELADIFKELEDRGAHNVNLVNPTHYWGKIIDALDIYKPNIPILANSHGYESIETLKKIDGYIDVYLPDIKYFSSTLSKRYSGRENYFNVASKAIEFMIENNPTVYEGDLIKKGVIVRHLVLPQATSDSKKVLDWFAQFKDKASISIMSQYTPYGDLENFPELKRKITKREYNSVIDYALSLEIENMFVQEMKSADEVFIPKWDF